MAKRNKVPEFLKMANDLKKNASRYAASESVKFFKESFVKGGFTDTSFLPWKKSASPLAGKRTLYKKGTLMQSIRKQMETMERVVVEADSEYAEIHNNGGYITVTERMKRYWWYQYTQLSGKVKKTKSGRVSMAKANRKVSGKAEFCKRMALMKVGTKIKIPKRQFMGESQTLLMNFESFFDGRVDVVFKQHLNNK
ncbi:hypothetical protein [Marinilabilia salmonicolor]|uniref:hypothetical protein n=1 Tax=Marinilabilia salmonicolor TaxID=989 RepID=UPI000299D70A|nr:hypothetical protein [Marinilabilia salmonicolor]